AAQQRRPRCRPRLEALEDRLLLSTRVWDGTVDGSGVAFTDANWTSAQNWVGDVAPVAGDDLVFPATALQYSTNNDFAPGTVSHSISIAGSSYTMAGNALALTAGITPSNTAGVNTIAMPLTLTAGQTITSGVAKTNLVLSGATLDNGGFPLTVAGSG